jgi:hypothetical protein
VIINYAAEVLRDREAERMKHDIASRHQRREGVSNQAVTKMGWESHQCTRERAVSNHLDVRSDASP